MDVSQSSGIAAQCMTPLESIDELLIKSPALWGLPGRRSHIPRSSPEEKMAEPSLEL